MTQIERIGEKSIKVTFDIPYLQKHGISKVAIFHSSSVLRNLVLLAIREIAKHKQIATDFLRNQFLIEVDLNIVDRIVVLMHLPDDVDVQEWLSFGYADGVVNIDEADEGCESEENELTPLDENEDENESEETSETSEAEYSATVQCNCIRCQELRKKSRAEQSDSYGDYLFSPIVFKFVDFEYLIQYAEAIEGVVDSENQVYSYNGAYYLVLLGFTKWTTGQAICITSHACEYAEQTNMDISFLKEYGTCIIESEAVQTLLKHFSNKN